MTMAMPVTTFLKRTTLGAAVLAATTVSTLGLAAKGGAPQPTSAAPSALGSAKEDDAGFLEMLRPASAAVPRVAAMSDVAFMRGVIWAFEPAPPEIRTQAIEDLGLLGDPRALNVLAQIALDPNPQFARAAVRATGLMHHTRAEEILCNIVRHPTLPEALKVQALELLPLQNTGSAIRFLNQVVGGGFSYAVQGAARTALSEIPKARGGLL